jgi:alpha-1,3/alpha-1,6-mannosyltransferase
MANSNDKTSTSLKKEESSSSWSSSRKQQQQQEQQPQPQPQQQQQQRTGGHHGSLVLSPPALHVVFVHLDLGLGGAEQLVLQLAAASQQAGHRVDLVTTRCEPHHCFAPVAPGGSLHPHLHIWGAWLPHHFFSILGPQRQERGRALCSTLRLAYLAYRVARKKSPDLIVLDVLSTPLPLLRLTDAALLFYCHFPDQLLTRRMNPGFLTRMYRRIMDRLEASTMACSDTTVVNSQFTRQTVLQTFPSLVSQQQTLPVLYPALDTSSLDAVVEQQQTKQYQLVSLNRFERKKNLGLLIEAAAWLREHQPDVKLPHIIIAGGYDVKNVENVEYRAELQQLADRMQVKVDFRLSISDAMRAELLHTSLAVVYTPAGEHFGIVPLEAMYAGTPVVAVNSGGPVETIIDSTTGYLCEPTAASFGQALSKLLQNPSLAAAMGQAGRQHVQENFGQERLLREWKELTELTVLRGRARLVKAGQYRLAKSLIYLMEALVTLFLCLLLTWMLRQCSILEPSESIWGSLRKALRRDEL